MNSTHFQIWHSCHGEAAGNACKSSEKCKGKSKKSFIKWGWPNLPGLWEYNRQVMNDLANPRWKSTQWTWHELLSPDYGSAWKTRLKAVTLLGQKTHRATNPKYKGGKSYHAWGHIRMLIRIDEEQGLWPIKDPRTGQNLEAGLYDMESTGYSVPYGGSAVTKFSCSEFRFKRIDNDPDWYKLPHNARKWIPSGKQSSSCGVHSNDHPFVIYTFENLQPNGKPPEVNREGSAGIFHTNPTYEIRLQYLEDVPGVPKGADVQKAVDGFSAPFKSVGQVMGIAKNRWKRKGPDGKSFPD
jgi:hypothetical protein